MPVTFLTSEDEKKFVKTINGVSPDPETGEVAITIPNSGGNVDQSAECENLDLFYSAIIRRKANPKKPLDITTYPGGGDQPTHPKVLYFPNGWNGHKYWMAYTPYPGNNNQEENPCITYSEDGIAWSEDGISNPIVPTPSSGYNSDCHLVMVGNTMECWWRNVNSSNVEIIKRKKSTDGINWGAEEVLFTTTKTADAGSCVSPSVIFEEGKYKIWVVYQRSCLKYYESADGTNWQFVKDISTNLTPLGDYKLWHFDMIKTDKGYEFVGCYQLYGAFDKNNYIAYSWSADNQTFAPAVCVLANGVSGRFDDLELYRPSLVKIGNKYRMYYGAQKEIRIWHIGVVEAPNMELLHELLEQYSGVVLPNYEGTADSGGYVTANNFAESTWTSGYYGDGGVLTTHSGMYHSDLMPIATAGGTVSTTVTGQTLLRVSYFGADFTYCGRDMGNGLDADPNYYATEIEVLANVEGAVYYAISCNTDDKNKVSVTVSESGDDSGGGDSGETEKTLTSISATYSGGNVTVGTAVSALSGVTVKAHYSDGSSANVTGYTLSGTISEGVNTVTVSYGGKTTTFTVTGVPDSGGDDTGTGIVNNFDESNWYVGMISDSGEVTTSGNMHYSDLIKYPMERTVVKTTAPATTYLRICYFDADKNYIGKDHGNGLGNTPAGGNYDVKEVVLSEVENAAYFVVNCNTADKSQVTVVAADVIPDIDTTNATVCYAIPNRGSDDSAWEETNGGESASVAGGVWHDDYLALSGTGSYIVLPVVSASKFKIALRSEQTSEGYIFDCRETATCYLSSGSAGLVGATLTVDSHSKKDTSGTLNGVWHVFEITFNSAFTGNIRIGSRYSCTSNLQCDIGWIVVQ